MADLVTGVAGFIGAAVAEKLLAQGSSVIGIDNLNDYYDVSLKKARLERLQKMGKGSFSFYPYNIADKEAIFGLEASCRDVTHVLNLAAQAGVRYSIENPFVYVESNVMGFVVMAELARRLPKLKHFIYASSSSVYGGNDKIPFSPDDAVDQPISVYAATKRSDELLAYTFAHLYKMPCTGLRFFTVYGPWGRPDMAAYSFTSKIIAGQPIPVFNNGNMRRDFTYIDDIVHGILGVLNLPFKEVAKTPTRVYNLGNSRSERLMDYIGAIEKALGKKAIYTFLPMQPGDIEETFADITASAEDFGYAPTTTIQEGIPRFVEWYKAYHRV
ncbi:MAG: GDP-mannose 4,6-dehydratase [Alphaproteobacteria bacterium]|nr:GDP-mannose 4,6-dehydratase [Alphaproteobacteria bacterium]